MTTNGFVKDLVFKTARHLWGRCPNCGSPFRLSDANVSSSPEPPRDWLRRLTRQEAALAEQEAEIAGREDDLENRELELYSQQRELERGQDRLERDAERRARQLVKSKPEWRNLLRMESNAAVRRSRAVLLGRLLERIAPCFRKFPYDPRDMRSICDPVDYILFDGLTVERKVSQILFIEVKCGRSRLTGVQRSIRDAVESGRTGNVVWNIGDPNIPIVEQFTDGNGSRRVLSAAQDEGRP